MTCAKYAIIILANLVKVVRVTGFIKFLEWRSASEYSRQ